MKPLTMQTLQELIAVQQVKVKFPTFDTEATVRQLTPEEMNRAHAAIIGKEESVDLNHEVDVLIASIGMVDGDYDNDAGREAIKKLPRPMLRKITDTICGLSGADGVTEKN